MTKSIIYRSEMIKYCGDVSIVNKIVKAGKIIVNKYGMTYTVNIPGQEEPITTNQIDTIMMEMGLTKK